VSEQDEPEQTTVRVVTNQAALDALYEHWRAVAERTAATPSAPVRPSRPAGTQCPKCGSGRLHTAAVGDLACRDCGNQWRPPSSPTGVSCPKCGSGRAHTRPYGDWYCRDCAHQWRMRWTPAGGS
jgi:ribosomal protein L37AE/L43A